MRNRKIIEGKYTDAVCYASIMEKQAAEQIQTICNQPFAEGSKIRIMPDVHLGKSCCIGTTMTIQNSMICPNLVGVDIGCGMFTVKLAEKDLDFKAVDMACHDVPSGMNWHRYPVADFDLESLYCASALHDKALILCSLGTLGGGNHFIEIDSAADGTKYLVIHSGSRNLGKQVAEYYQSIAVSETGNKATLRQKRNALIASYKAAGREKELSNALAELNKSTPVMPADLAYLTGENAKSYLHDIVICQDYALRNRKFMARQILHEAGLHAVDSFETIHNYIAADEMILRKGSIAAHKGQKVLIPVNMRDGSILAVGKGNPDWNESAPHGAGRIMSRSAAKKNLSVDEFRHEMKGVYSTSIGESTLDEAPMAYKSISDIIDDVQETVDIAEVLKPVYNFKAD